jgi:hypothetical protein
MLHLRTQGHNKSSFRWILFHRLMSSPGFIPHAKILMSLRFRKCQGNRPQPQRWLPSTESDSLRTSGNDNCIQVWFTSTSKRFHFFCSPQSNYGFNHQEVLLQGTLSSTIWLKKWSHWLQNKFWHLKLTMPKHLNKRKFIQNFIFLSSWSLPLNVCSPDVRIPQC